ncbi:WYL domain-containing protein [Arthrobacter tumbae]|uniref:helix-turn-helix transcriptional regulator n=1 Tax=Arthrobacter tumbae TaxID=163874 RepID=UPI00195652B1|nr:WYL domain-containing protein [Arthrobacter tumbae]MBM7783133.1 proteasome accessory factor C [Arthrobacter tumbae]
MSAKRTERLLTLVMLLLSTRQGWTKEELFREIEQYEQAPTAAAREKLFDRDKATLREQGIPLESFTEDPLFDNDNASTRYRINADEYRLPGMSFTAAESAALTIAAGMWKEASLGSAASRALRKLQGRGVGAELSPPPPIDARIQTNEPFWDELWQATSARRAVRFGYRAASTGEERERRVQPWGMGSRFGHWYLVGFDLDRKAERWFRLSRMTTPPATQTAIYSVPPHFSMSASLATLNAEALGRRATVAVRTGTCHLLRTRPGANSTPRSGGWDTLEFSYADEGAAAREIASFGSNAEALSPEPLVAEVRRRLDGAARALRDAPPSYSFDGKAAKPASGRPTSSTEDRLLRLLDLVPYLLNHPGVEVAVAARDFGISPAQLITDVELIFVSGPRFYPDGLIDIQLEDDRIHISDPQFLGDPIRFGLDEVCALLVGLDALINLPGLPDDSAVRSAREKLRAGAGDAGRMNDSIATRITEDEVAPVLATVRAGIEQQRQLHLRYVVPARDEVTERFVEPLGAFLHQDAWYLDAWCHSAGGRRNFRLDRVQQVELTDLPATAKAETPSAIFDPTGAHSAVVLVLTPGAQWIVESYAAERTATTADGRVAAEIMVSTSAWLPGLVASLGGECSVAEPETERESALRFVEAALAVYAPRTGN